MPPVPGKEMIFRTVIIAVMGIFTVMLITKPEPWLPLLDNANLLIHEAGHTFLAGFGDYISTLGGTLVQVFTPILFLSYFAYQKQFFSSGFTLFWLGNNLINVSVYIKDARVMLLPVIGGGIHDWNYLLGKVGWLSQDKLIGGGVYFLGVICVLAGLGICVYTWYAGVKGIFSR